MRVKQAPRVSQANWKWKTAAAAAPRKAAPWKPAAVAVPRKKQASASASASQAIEKLDIQFLSKVLSMVDDAKQVAVACCVSKAWYHAARNVSTLHVDVDGAADTEELTFWLKLRSELVHLSVEGSSQRACLDCARSVQGTLKTLEITTTPNKHVIGELSDFSSVLTSLVLKGKKKPLLEFPEEGSYGFPELKRLVLSHVAMKSEGDLENLVAACPKIEELDFRLIYGEGEAVVKNASLGRMPYLRRLFAEVRKTLTVEAPELQALWFNGQELVINGQCPHLTKVAASSAVAAYLADKGAKIRKLTLLSGELAGVSEMKEMEKLKVDRVLTSLEAGELPVSMPNSLRYVTVHTDAGDKKFLLDFISPLLSRCPMMEEVKIVGLGRHSYASCDDHDFWTELLHIQRRHSSVEIVADTVDEGSLGGGLLPRCYQGSSCVLCETIRERGITLGW